jgi:hypothetical protein
MGLICIQCPRTGQQVFTGVEIDRAHFNQMSLAQSTMHCWICGGEHTWSKRWAILVERPSTQARMPLRSGVQRADWH